MRPTHLLAVVALFCAGQIFAQATPKPSTAGNRASESLTSAADQLNINENARIDFFAQNATESGPMGRIHAGQYNPFQRPLELPPRHDSDVACYKIADYIVVRDYPNSDSTHLAGYTTCVPAERFRVYTTVEHGR
jgi:hypothetical protein